jgi:hypothetical protein
MDFWCSLVLDILLNFTIIELLFYVLYMTKFYIMSCWCAYVYSDNYGIMCVCMYDKYGKKKRWGIAH